MPQQAASKAESLSERVAHIESTQVAQSSALNKIVDSVADLGRAIKSLDNSVSSIDSRVSAIDATANTRANSINWANLAIAVTISCAVMGGAFTLTSFIYQSMRGEVLRAKQVAEGYKRESIANKFELQKQEVQSLRAEIDAVIDHKIATRPEKVTAKEFERLRDRVQRIEGGTDGT